MRCGEEGVAGMGEKIKIDEDIIVRSRIDIMASLPFRLQKRYLFKMFGFPCDKRIVAIPVIDENRVRKMLEKFITRGKSFIIIVSPKPMMTRIPPFFMINVAKEVLYRDAYDKKKRVGLNRVLSLISSLPSQSWVEFARDIWGDSTIAGRLLYLSASEQTLEIRKGAEIPDIDREPNKALRLELSFFEPSDKRVFGKAVLNSKLKRYEVDSITTSFGDCIRGFEHLRKVGDFPTVEFAYTEEGLIIIDVDWPSQYKP